MSATAPRPASRRQLAVNVANAVNAMTSAIRAAQEAGIDVALTCVLNGQKLDVTSGLFSVRFQEELYPTAERPEYGEIS